MKKFCILFCILTSACGLSNETAKDIARRAKTSAANTALELSKMNERLSAMEGRLESLERLGNYDAAQRTLYGKKNEDLESEIYSLREMFRESKIK